MIDPLLSVGIDPGLKGAIAFLDGSDDTVRIKTTPTLGAKDYDTKGMYHLLAEVYLPNSHIFIEDVITIPGKTSIKAAKTIGRGAGLWEGLAAAMFNRPLTVIPAKEWQKAMFAGIPRRYKKKRTAKGKLRLDTKLMSIIAAKRLFPDVSLRRTDKCKKDDHNMADALLIAAYGRRQA